MTVAVHPETARAQARGDKAERLVDVALDLAVLVRDEDAAAIGSYLDRLTAADRYRLLIILAAMVPVDSLSKEELLGWVTFDEFGQPLEGVTPVLPIFDRETPDTPFGDCGTLRAYWRHRRRGETHAQTEACGCAQASRDRSNAKYAAGRGGDVAARGRKGDAEAARDLFARCRAGGGSIPLAAMTAGVSERTGQRYESALVAAGKATWRAAAGDGQQREGEAA